MRVRARARAEWEAARCGARSRAAAAPAAPAVWEESRGLCRAKERLRSVRSGRARVRRTPRPTGEALAPEGARLLPARARRRPSGPGLRLAKSCSAGAFATTHSRRTPLRPLRVHL